MCVCMSIVNTIQFISMDSCYTAFSLRERKKKKTTVGKGVLGGGEREKQKDKMYVQHV